MEAINSSDCAFASGYAEPVSAPGVVLPDLPALVFDAFANIRHLKFPARGPPENQRGQQINYPAARQMLSV
jgi:hypothetical protein